MVFISNEKIKVVRRRIEQCSVLWGGAHIWYQSRSAYIIARTRVPSPSIAFIWQSIHEEMDQDG